MNVRAANSRMFLRLGFVLCFLIRTLLAQSAGNYDRGLAEFRSANYAAAAKLFASTEAAFPGKTDALLYQAKSLVHLPDFWGAEKALRGYLASHNDSSDALYLLGFVLNRLDRPAESLQIYTHAATIIQPASDDLKIVGLDYVLLGDYADAIKWLEKAVQFDPQNGDAWYFLGRAYYTRARLTEAQKAFQKVLDLDPRNARAENNLGLIFETQGNPMAAMTAYRKAIAWQQGNLHPSAQPYVNLGNLLMEQGKLQEAAAPLEKAVALAPNDGFCRLRLGVSYRALGRLADAQLQLEKATQLSPGDANAHYQLGRLYTEMHEPDRAKAEFARTAALKDRDSEPTAAAPDSAEK